MKVQGRNIREDKTKKGNTEPSPFCHLDIWNYTMLTMARARFIPEQ